LSSHAQTQRRRKAPEERRQEILDATVETAIHLGLDAVTARDVARTAGVVSGLIHHYFGTVEELIAEAFGTWADRVLDDVRRLPTELPAPVRIAALVSNLTPAQRFWHDALSAAVRHRELRKRARALTIAYVDHVETVIQDGIREGSIVCPDPRTSAWRIILMVDGLVPMIFVVRLLDLARARHLLAGVVERELGLQAGSFESLELPTLS
jgi:AcrR family transcriptional regulator